MKKVLTTLLACSCVLAAGASVKVTYKAGAPDKVRMMKATVDQLASGKRFQWEKDSADVIGGVATLDFATTTPSQFILELTPGNYSRLYALPGENLEIEVTQTEPLHATKKGNSIVESLNELENRQADMVAEFNSIANPTDAQQVEFSKQYQKTSSDFVKANLNNPAVIFVMPALDGEEFMAAYEQVGPAVKESAFWPIAEGNYASVKRSMEQMLKQEALKSGEAPDFTLKNLEGKDVSLSNFRGKWVIIDFWGSWCRWCIKGIPEMKEAYAKYSPKLEIIGVDCGDTDAQWRGAVEKYQLPWVHVYNPGGPDSITDAYVVQGYPTKVIVNPEGKVADYVIGEDPAFYTKLAELMK